ncbi:11332_t:CDS:2 [Paraglomus occultum]|uniref:11332_t:CDS:1 n=1 Tax=Paraglomus occultum TaxID=144539 RepID=A0A9N8ZF18_9GLOM|nr:11332_t:CDS:2 [Paraglomus occultum]
MASQKHVEGRNRSKNRYFSRNKGLKANISGVFVSCTRGKEGKAVGECYDLFTRYANELYPIEEESLDEVDIALSIDLERQQLTAKSNRFMSIPIDAGCLIFIKVEDPVAPVELVHAILNDLAITRQKSTRFIQRLIPIEKTCHAKMEDIECMARKLLKPHFHPEDENEKRQITFAIQPRIRFNQKIVKMDLIKKIAEVVGDGHVVNLNDPELVIIVEIFKACMSICQIRHRFYPLTVDDLHLEHLRRLTRKKLKKYNNEEVCDLRDSHERDTARLAYEEEAKGASK